MQIKPNEVQVKEAIESLVAMLDWSDRIGSDERYEIELIISMLTVKIVHPTLINP